MVYLKKDTPRYSHALDMTSETASVKCTLVTLDKVESGEFKFRGVGGVMDQTDCNKSYGAIKRIRDQSKCRKIFE